ncbi:MAG: hypothetical protein MZW92_14920 [Comamonadaceae bacterium]|nr:hypothetical protein [Comamonadaceae bacterium]
MPHTLIADNAAGHLLQQGRVDAVIVGADRIAANGDVANKIGTYLKALAARGQPACRSTSRRPARRSTGPAPTACADPDRGARAARKCAWSAGDGLRRAASPATTPR